MKERKRIPKKAGQTRTKSNIRSEIVSLVMIAFGLIVVLGVFFDASGAAGRFLKDFLMGLMGYCAYPFSLWILVYGIHLIVAGKIPKRHNAKYFLLLGIFVVASAILQLFAMESYDDSFFENVRQIYASAKTGIGGGLIGAGIAIPLNKLFAAMGTGVILFAALIILFVILTEFAPISFAVYLAGKVTDWFKNRAAKKKSSKEEGDFALPGTDDGANSKKKLKLKKEESTDEAPPFEIDEPDFQPEIKIYPDPAEHSEIYEELIEEPEQLKLIEEDEMEEEDSTPVSIEIKRDEPIPYTFPPLDLLSSTPPEGGEALDKPEDLRQRAQKLTDTLKSFGVEAKVLEVSRGPSVTRFELQPSPGVKVSKIVNLADDIALNLAAFGVRIEAPIPGKAAVGIEIPNKSITTVPIRDVLESETFRRFPSKVAFALGKDIAGNTIVGDIAKMPHLLIAGATGSGKSVCINSLIVSILYKANPNEVKLLMIDPKVVELGVYNGIPHLLIPVVTDPRKAAGALNWAVQEMIRRYKMFAEYNVRDLKGYNILARESDEPPLEQIVIIIDELADLMMVAPKEVEDAVCRLAQMARAAGMHLVIATQRPSVDVITGLIKANIPSRIAFAVSSSVDSRTILDMSGAEKLLGRGDMLYLPSGASKPIRIQGSYISDKEVERIVEYVKQAHVPEYDEDVLESIERSDSHESDDPGDCDELLEQAIAIVVECGQASVSLLQRKLKIGYSRAGRIIDQMEARGIVGPYEGSKPRAVLITKQQYYEMMMNN